VPPGRISRELLERNGFPARPTCEMHRRRCAGERFRQEAKKGEVERCGGAGEMKRLSCVFLPVAHSKFMVF
jgi:hypothetical protein